MKRISIVVLILCLCFGSVAWAQQAAGKCFNNWTEFHRTNMERSNPCEKVLNVNNVVNLNLKWVHLSIYTPRSSPAVDNGLIYYTHGGILYAFKLNGERVNWWGSRFSRQASSPAVANGMVYVGSYDDKVNAFNASDLNAGPLWSYTTGGVVWSSPAVANGVVYVGSDDKNLYALNASTGSLLWSYTTGGMVFSSPAVANGVVYVGSADHKVYGLNASTGAKLWNRTAGHAVQASPAVVDGVVYAPSSHGMQVYALK